MRLTRKELSTFLAAVIYVSIILFGYYIICQQTTAAATWERRYNTAKETEQRAVELLGETVREFEDYKVMIELDKQMEEAARAQAMAHYEALGQYHTSESAASPITAVRARATPTSAVPAQV